jgi:hypothetical protein
MGIKLTNHHRVTTEKVVTHNEFHGEIATSKYNLLSSLLLISQHDEYY